MNSKKLGFGLMRLPLTDPNDTRKIDYKTASEMVDRYMEAGFNYFDTAAPYHGGKSEEALRECVVKRYPRDSFTITDKLTFFMISEADQLEDFFESQLERCGTEYFDYYLLHAMNKDYLEQAERMGAFDFVQKKKAEGKIRHIGFSFHDSPEVLDEILTRHPEMELVQLQLNYADWDNPDVQSRACYETAVRHGKPVLVMEPVKGGLLASLPEDIEAMFKEKEPEMSTASWAVRFAASHPGVAMVLSGMSNPEQVEDNLSYMEDFKPLSEDEQKLVHDAADLLASKASIACTGCRYCVDDCPKKIPIPEFFKMMNNVSQYGPSRIAPMNNKYRHQTENLGLGKASDCIHCRQCEQHCPQHLPITEYLEQTAEIFE
ncbi:aldo/keto reductase [Allobaculum mucilyticum]|uniref:aldo/keto reductase n=1 Tax=Allobaculum mucilyticum TaxID=2834459 RepID=UPI001E531217|nr:aldo/keto reductase [Allobaculum mucilyticum]UNT96551.1 aldo/keto reductase [Allobaculum mucilyticum]